MAFRLVGRCRSRKEQDVNTDRRTKPLALPPKPNPMKTFPASRSAITRETHHHLLPHQPAPPATISPNRIPNHAVRAGGPRVVSDSAHQSRRHPTSSGPRATKSTVNICARSAPVIGRTAPNAPKESSIVPVRRPQPASPTNLVTCPNDAQNNLQPPPAAHPPGFSDRITRQNAENGHNRPADTPSRLSATACPSFVLAPP